MSGKTRAERRPCDGALNLYPVDTTLGWRVIGITTAAQAAEKLACGQWREVYDEQGNHLGYQIVANFQTDQEMPGKTSACAVTARESELNAGLGGKSRTLGMPEAKRLSRPAGPSGRAPAPEDAIERVKEKVKEWGRRRLCVTVMTRPMPDAAQCPFDTFPEFAKLNDSENTEISKP
jgi:hypothetical protein